MDHKLFPRTSLFDQISFLMVGAIATIITVLDVAYMFTMPLPVIDLGSALAWLAIAYFAGHLIQILSNAIRDIPLIPLLDWEATPSYLPHEKKLFEEARVYFKQNDQEHKADYLWNICYMFAIGKDATGQVETFSAYYNLYRGWFTTLLLEAILLGYLSVVAYTPTVLAFFLLSLLGSFLFYRRAKRFWQYLNDKVFGIFTIIKAETTQR